jgi:phosphoglycerate dehydrogenase-like enzyme
MIRAAVLDDYQRRASELADWGSLRPDVETSFFHDPIREADLPHVLSEFDVLVLMRERTAFPGRVLERLPQLRLLVTTGMRNASVDSAYLHEQGIAYAGTATGGNGPIEVAWGLILALAKRLVVEDRAIRTGAWQLGLPRNLSGATLGLAGLGRVGSAMVVPAHAFGMDVIAWSENLTEARAAEAGARRVDKATLLRESDVLSIHLVLSSRTRGLFGADELAAMKRSAFLVNTSRGPIVDEAALVAALRSETIAAAGLDVYDQEPLPAGHPLLALGNTVLAPHLGYVSEEGLRAMYGQVVEDIRGFLEGHPIRTIQ